ncbi:hypothetical protein GF352_03090 [archaeon]|nr:hypothetical protein [archaeon]
MTAILLVNHSSNLILKDYYKDYYNKRLINTLMKLVLTDIDSKKGVIRLFGENKKGEKIIVKDDGFKPYFYVKDLPAKKIKKLKIGDYKIVSVKKLGDKHKVTVNESKGVKPISEKIKSLGGKVKEKDIPFTQRYLIDKDLTMLKGFDSDKLKKCGFKWEPRVMAFDIETGNKKGVPDSSIDEVLMISIWTNYGVKKLLINGKEFDDKRVQSFKNEKAMLKEFNRLIKETNPSIIATYNGDMFDWPFIRDRMNNHGIKRDYGVDGSTMTIINRGVSSTARIKGLSHVDLYVFVNKILSANLKTSTLDLGSVSEELIDNTKKEMDWDEFYSEWDKGNLKRIVEYSLTDAKVTYELFNKLKPILFELARMVNQPLYETCRSSYSSLVENYLIKRAKEFNETIPRLPSRSTVGARHKTSFTGGYVHQPEAGIYEDIAVVDFRSLYPTIIVSYNIGPGTISTKGLKIKVDGREHHFNQEEKGFIPSVVKDLVKTRAEIKKELRKKKDPLLEARSYAIKTVTNATYGYLSYPRSRWYCFDCSESITALGREHIKKVIDKAVKAGFGVCYGDTDSAFLTLGDRTKKELEAFLKKINKELPGIMELELERICPRGLFVAGKKGKKGVKKRYALIDEEGELIIKGFEFVRGDWSNISKKTQYRVFQALLKDNSRSKAISVVKKVVNKLRENKVPIKDLVLRTQLTKNINQYKSIGPHVAVAKRLAEKGYPVSAGTIINYVVIEGEGLIREKARTVDEVKEQGLKPDAEYYIHHQVIPAVDRVLDVLEVSGEEFEKQKQEKLADFL